MYEQLILMLILILLFPAAGVATSVVRERRASSSWLERTVTERVIVHTTADQSIEGLMVQAGPNGVLLEAARLLQESGNVDMAGSVWVPGPKVHLIQKAPG